jgi:hypothetical protein
MPADDALLLALVIAGLIVLLAGKRRRTQLFGAVLTKGKKGGSTRPLFASGDRR